MALRTGGAREREREENATGSKDKDESRTIEQGEEEGSQRKRQPGDSDQPLEPAAAKDEVLGVERNEMATMIAMRTGLRSSERSDAPLTQQCGWPGNHVTVM